MQHNSIIKASGLPTITALEIRGKRNRSKEVNVRGIVRNKRALRLARLKSAHRPYWHGIIGEFANSLMAQGYGHRRAWLTAWAVRDRAEKIWAHTQEFPRRIPLEALED